MLIAEGSNVMSDSLSFYRKYLGYSNEELVQLSHTDEEALEALLFKNEGLVRDMVRKYSIIMKGNAFDTEDLFQEGSIALAKAAQTYNPDGTGKFSTYAGENIKWSIIRFIHNNSGAIRLPVYLQEEIRQVKNTFKDLGYSEYDSDEAIGRVASTLGYEARKVIELLTYDEFKNIRSLNAPLNDDSGSTLEDTIADEDNSLQSSLEKEAASRAIINVLNSVLTDREADIVKRLNGLDGHECETLEAIGNSYGISKARVHSIKSKCYSKLAKVPGFKELFAA